MSLHLVRLGRLTGHDFEKRDGGMLLTRPALQRYLAAFDAEMNARFAGDEAETSFRELFRRQAERLGRTFVHGDPYRGFRLPC